MLKLKLKIENKLLKSESAINHRFFFQNPPKRFCQKVCQKYLLPTNLYFGVKTRMIKSIPASLYSERTKVLLQILSSVRTSCELKSTRESSSKLYQKCSLGSHGRLIFIVNPILMKTSSHIL